MDGLMFTVDAILAATQAAAQRYYRLVIVAAPIQGGKTTLLRQAQMALGAAWVNVGLELSGHLLEMTERQRALRVNRVLDEILAPYPPEQMVIFDNTEILFDRALALNPMNLLQGLARSRTLIVSWSGRYEDGWLTYAAPGHAEYQRYPTQDVLVISPPPGAQQG